MTPEQFQSFMALPLLSQIITVIITLFLFVTVILWMIMPYVIMHMSSQVSMIYFKVDQLQRSINRVDGKIDKLEK